MHFNALLMIPTLPNEVLYGYLPILYTLRISLRGHFNVDFL